MKLLRCTLLNMLTLALLALSLGAIAQPYPIKPIRLIVSDAAGARAPFLSGLRRGSETLSLPNQPRRE